MAAFTNITQTAQSAERVLLCAILAQARHDLHRNRPEDIRRDSVRFFRNEGGQLEWMALALDLDYRLLQQRIFEQFPDVVYTDRDSSDHSQLEG